MKGGGRTRAEMPNAEMPKGERPGSDDSPFFFFVFRNHLDGFRNLQLAAGLAWGFRRRVTGVRSRGAAVRAQTPGRSGQTVHGPRGRTGRDLAPGTPGARTGCPSRPCSPAGLPPWAGWRRKTAVLSSPARFRRAASLGCQCQPHFLITPGRDPTRWPANQSGPSPEACPRTRNRRCATCDSAGTSARFPSGRRRAGSS
jgi:hypothetical protein